MRGFPGAGCTETGFFMGTGYESLKQLFRQEFSKMVAVISKQFGLQHMETAEDIVSDTFLQAAETWGVKGIPENPVAWLYAVAKQKTLYQFRRNKIFEEKVLPQIGVNDNTTGELNFSEQSIKDSQLQMLFAVCNPAIAGEAQIGLALRILCGFGIDEIAEAFFSNKETINKRLFRAKEKLRTEKINMELPPENKLAGRLDNVLHIIYLLFNEGYFSKTQNQVLRKELCAEAIRLAILLTEYDKTNLPKTNALLALMCFHASRFDARQACSPEEGFILYDNQDEALWDTELIRRGIRFLSLATQGSEISSYHLEARIASLHCRKENMPGKWEEILDLYDELLLMNYSPAVVLNRIYALSRVKGNNEALDEAEKLKWDNNHFYFLLLGELVKNNDKKRAAFYFQKAMNLAKTQTEKNAIKQKLKENQSRSF
jgi:RNA polymerase sigma-70 factor (ECF subfamily)